MRAIAVVALLAPAIARAEPVERIDACAVGTLPFHLALGAAFGYAGGDEPRGPRLDFGATLPGRPWLGIEGRIADAGWADADGARHERVEIGLGVALRHCRWPAYLCGSLGVAVVGDRIDDGAFGALLAPYVAGEVGAGPIALRATAEARIGRPLGAELVGGIALRF